MTALLCCRILSTSLSVDTRGHSVLCMLAGRGDLVLLVMWGGTVEPQDMPVHHTKTRQRWSGDRRVVEGTIDQIMNICLFFFFFFSLPLFSLPLSPHPHLPSSFASSPAHIHRFHAAANAFFFFASHGCFMDGQKPVRDTSQCCQLTVIH